MLVRGRRPAWMALLPSMPYLYIPGHADSPYSGILPSHCALLGITKPSCRFASGKVQPSRPAARVKLDCRSDPGILAKEIIGHLEVGIERFREIVATLK